MEEATTYEKYFKELCKSIFVEFLNERELNFKKIKVNICPAQDFLSGLGAVVGIIDDEYYLYIMYNGVKKTCSVLPASFDPKGKTRDWLNHYEA